MGFVLEANLISVDNAIVLMASVTDQRNTGIMDISRDCFSEVARCQHVLESGSVAAGKTEVSGATGGTDGNDGSHFHA